MFYNTIELSGFELKHAHETTLKQEEFIERIFTHNQKALLSPSKVLEIYNKYIQKKVPITSIRRAMTNLTKKGVLRKTSVMAKGNYHLPEHCWCFKKNENVYLEWVMDDPNDLPAIVGGI